METLDKYREACEAFLGASLANEVVTSDQSLDVMRDISQRLDSLSVQLRKDFIEQKKAMKLTRVNSDNK